VSGSGWFRRQRSMLATGGATTAKRILRPTRATGAGPTEGGTADAAAAAPRSKRRGAALTAGSATLVLVSGVAFVVFASPGSHAAQVSTSGRAAARADLPVVALQVVSVTPAASAKGVNGANPITVQFSTPLASTSPMPTLSPDIAGNWQVEGNDAVFTPTQGYFQDTKVTVKIPAGPAGMLSAAGVAAGSGGYLSSPVTQSFTTGSFSTERLQELLAQLGYLPMVWLPKTAQTISPTNANAQLAAAYHAPAGSFAWQGDYPWNLKDQWKAGQGNILDTGAIRAFEYNQGLTMDGLAGHTVWSDLLKAVANGKHNPNGYTYGLANQNLPETLTIWHNGSVVLKSAANTGISDASTVDGTFPVYLRFYFTYMKGNNPDGTPYDDPVYYVSYFNGGDAVHYFPRGGYGYNQSLGCVELPWDAAKQAYPYLTYGSLVTVEGPVGA
jgi:hypothetical protein